MDPTKALIVIILTLSIVIIINMAIYYSFRRKKHEQGQIKLIQKAMGQARKPWGKEEKALEELSKRIANLEIDPRQRKNNDG